MFWRQGAKISAARTNGPGGVVEGRVKKEHLQVTLLIGVFITLGNQGL